MRVPHRHFISSPPSPSPLAHTIEALHGVEQQLRDVGRQHGTTSTIPQQKKRYKKTPRKPHARRAAKNT